jgi:hypothetical protein
MMIDIARPGSTSAQAPDSSTAADQVGPLPTSTHQKDQGKQEMERLNTLALRPMALTLAMVGTLLIGMILVQTGIVGASGETVVTLVPVGDARSGELITVKVLVRNAKNLAGYQGSVSYDAAALRLTGASVDGDLSRGGRGVMPLGPVMGDGTVALGAATCPISDCADSQPALARRSEHGINGTVNLGTLELLSSAPGSYQIDLAGVKLVDPQGNALEARVEPLTLEVRP